MFTGIIETVGILTSRRLSGGAGKLCVRPGKPPANMTPGESVAVNGVCLTFERMSGDSLEFHAMEETLSRSNLGVVPIGAPLNIERAMRADGRFGGHFVTGHVDSAGRVLEFSKKGADPLLKVSVPDDLSDLFVGKGSVALDGVSLTIAETGADWLSVCLIPTTLDGTNLRGRRPGDLVNIEADMIAKHIKKQLGALRGGSSGRISEETLRRAGWEI
jgi:riboflavin synthase